MDRNIAAWIPGRGRLPTWDKAPVWTIRGCQAASKPRLVSEVDTLLCGRDAHGWRNLGGFLEEAGFSWTLGNRKGRVEGCRVQPFLPPLITEVPSEDASST